MNTVFQRFIQVLVLATALLFFHGCVSPPGPMPTVRSNVPGKGPNQELTENAWNAFTARNYEKAIGYADRCIDMFAATADDIQAEMSGEAIPKTAGFSAQEKEATFARGPLNDVAACLFIKGESLSKLGRKSEAKAAYRALTKYRHAAVWDLRGWFWLPAEEAARRL